MSINNELNVVTGSRSGGKRILKAGAALTLCALLAACNTHREKSVKGWLVADPTARHPIMVGSAPVTLDLAVVNGATRLDQNQTYELRHFLRQYKERNEGPLVVAAPSGGSNEIAVMHVLGDVRREFTRAGVSRGEVTFEAYTGVGAAAAPIKVTYRTFKAHAPTCGDWSDSLSRDPQNVPYRNLGCAAQANLAAMIANPRDLVEPRGMTARDGQRRDVIMDKYVRGDTTVADKASEEGAKVSEVDGGGQE